MTVVQSPGEAKHSSMPSLRDPGGVVQHVMTASELGAFVGETAQA